MAEGERQMKAAQERMTREITEMALEDETKDDEARLGDPALTRRIS